MMFWPPLMAPIWMLVGCFVGDVSAGDVAADRRLELLLHYRHFLPCSRCLGRQCRPLGPVKHRRTFKLCWLLEPSNRPKCSSLPAGVEVRYPAEVTAHPLQARPAVLAGEDEHNVRSCRAKLFQLVQGDVPLLKPVVDGVAHRLSCFATGVTASRSISAAKRFPDTLIKMIQKTCAAQNNEQ
jgi:hypothetical protein